MVAGATNRSKDAQEGRMEPISHQYQYKFTLPRRMVGRKAEYTITGSSQLAWKEPRKKKLPIWEKD